MEDLPQTRTSRRTLYSIVRVWHRRILANKLEWPLDARLWDNALQPGRGRGPTRNLKELAVRLGWVPAHGGWTCKGQWFLWDEATLRAKWDLAQVLCAEVARTNGDFEGLAAGLSTCAYRQLKLDGQSQKEDRKAALNAALGGVWHEERAHSAGEGVENLEHIVHHCPHWNKERPPACVRLHGLLPAPPPDALPTHEPALVMKAGVRTVWTDGSGRHSSNPHFR
eukprot:36575-Amphidinium_carterae.2